MKANALHLVEEAGLAAQMNLCVRETQLFKGIKWPFVTPKPPPTQGSPKQGETLQGGEVKTPPHTQPCCPWSPVELGGQN